MGFGMTAEGQRSVNVALLLDLICSFGPTYAPCDAAWTDHAIFGLEKGRKLSKSMLCTDTAKTGQAHRMCTLDL